MTFTSFLKEYAEENPKPRLTITGLGWQFWGTLVTSAASIILAALRTAQTFYAAAILSSTLFFPDGGDIAHASAYIDLVVAMLTIEGGIVIYGAIRSEQENKLRGWIMPTQIFTLVVISALAGFGQSLGLIANLSPQVLEYYSYLIAGVLGFGATFIAWLNGEILGAQMAKYRKARVAAVKLLDKEMRAYLREAKAAYKLTEKRMLPRRKAAVKANNDAIREFVDKYKREHGKNPTISDVVRGTGESRSAVRAIVKAT